MVFAFSAVAQAADKVTSKDIAKGAVTKKAIKKGAVTKKAIKKGAVTSKALKAASVTGAAIADAAVGTAALADGSVTTAKLADTSVTTPKLGNGAVTAAKLGGDVSAQFGSGLLSAYISTPAAGGNLATIGNGAPIGDGSEYDMPIPTAMTVTDLIAVPENTSPRVIEIRIQKNGAEALSCEIAANGDSCSTDQSVDFAPGDTLGVQVFVQGGPDAVGNNDYAISYRVTG
jgi:hypothetical protein